MQIDPQVKNSVALAGLILISATVVAQPFSVGHKSVEFYDSDRDRNVATEIYYPADVAGNDVPVSVGNFPVLVYGHGFVMGWDSYANVWNDLVPKGYVICCPNTETSFSPDHGQFGLDIRFIAAQMQLEAQDNNSIFFNSLAPETALMGHSMGGGASFLAAENNPNITALVNFAAAETNPSAIMAARNITVPSLIFSATSDCVAPANVHQDIMYDSLSSSCKTQVNLINGGHCNFANSNTFCGLGETFCGGSGSLTRTQQQAVTSDLLGLWLDYTLRGNLNSFAVFNDSLVSSTRVSYSQQCLTVGLTDLSATNELGVYPNPVIDKFDLRIPNQYTDGILTMFNLVGQQVDQRKITSTIDEVDMTSYPTGTYFLRYEKNAKILYNKIIKIVR